MISNLRLAVHGKRYEPPGCSPPDGVGDPEHPEVRPR